MSLSEAFPRHVFDVLGAEPRPFADRLPGDIRVFEKSPADGPSTVMTLGVSRLPTDSGESVELAVEVLEGQEGAAFVALEIVSQNIAEQRRVPPVGAPWRNGTAFLSGTEMSALLVTGSRWGESFDEVRNEDGSLAGRVLTLRLLTDAEARFAQRYGWEALVAAAGSLDELLDVRRESTVGDDEAEGARTIGGEIPVFLTKMHDEHPPRWVTYTGADVRSVVGLESPEYMDDPSLHEVVALSTYLKRFPFVEPFLRAAAPGQTGFFEDQSGAYAIEDD